ncbi:MAG: hypothetical protein IKR04_05770 [Clostridia bacterium]|nr:hypothetical protein [Clostridia bacterium]
MNDRLAYDLLVDYLKYIIDQGINKDIRFNEAQKELLKNGIDLYCEELKRMNGK